MQRVFFLYYVFFLWIYDYVCLYIIIIISGLNLPLSQELCCFKRDYNYLSTRKNIGWWIMYYNCVPCAITHKICIQYRGKQIIFFNLMIRKSKVASMAGLINTAENLSPNLLIKMNRIYWRSTSLRHFFAIKLWKKFRQILITRL